jgi:hypothetical protein
MWDEKGGHMTRFGDIPIGTRFLYHGHLYLKMLQSAAECMQGLQRGVIFYVAADAIIEEMTQ